MQDRPPYIIRGPVDYIRGRIAGIGLGWEAIVGDRVGLILIYIIKDNSWHLDTRWKDVLPKQDT